MIEKQTAAAAVGLDFVLFYLLGSLGQTGTA